MNNKNDPDKPPQSPRKDIIPSMKRRADFNDYHGRCIYMVTMVLEGRKPLLGTLNAPSSEKAVIDLSPLGKAVRDCWQAIPQYHPEVNLILFQIMPDHFHGLLFVTSNMETHLGRAIRGFKQGCDKAFRLLLPELAAEASKRQAIEKGKKKTGFLFEIGYNDRVLVEEDQLKTLIDYILDNPRRLALRHGHPEFFHVYTDYMIAGLKCSIQGNLELLKRPCMQVRISRSISPDTLAKEQQRLIGLAKEGTVLVSPCISPGEKAIMREAFNARLPMIVLLDKGIDPISKPSGERFDACAEGRILLISPFPCSTKKKKISREECLQLNALAFAIVHRQRYQEQHPQP